MKRFVLGAGFLIAASLAAWSASAFYVPNEVKIPSIKERRQPGPVTFSHWRHNAYQCYNCHPSLFPRLREGFDHDEMKAGKRCGSCHNGVAAFAHKSKPCTQCHAESGERP